MAVFGAGFVEPLALIAHEISKPASISIPRMLDECREPRCEHLGQLRFAAFGKRACEQKRARVVVNTIAMRSVRDGMSGVLK